VFSNDWILVGILVVAFILASFITIFIANRIGRTISEKYKRWVYFLVSLLPLNEWIKMVNLKTASVKTIFFWFWFLFWIFCLYMCWKYRNPKNVKEHDSKEAT
jgi:DMSO/TMAO reductase YedYZ heme-binding membrane subunit